MIRVDSFLDDEKRYLKTYIFQIGRELVKIFNGLK